MHPAMDLHLVIHATAAATLLLIASFLILAVSICQAEDGIRDLTVTGVQTCALPIYGLRVLLLEDHRSPIVSFQVWYRVGSRNEARGATGIAHFLEHMMFKGTPPHGRGQFARLDRKIVVSGKTADIAGRRIIKTTRYP